MVRRKVQVIAESRFTFNIVLWVIEIIQAVLVISQQWSSSFFYIYWSATVTVSQFFSQQWLGENNQVDSSLIFMSWQRSGVQGSKPLVFYTDRLEEGEILTSGCWLNSWPTKEDPLRVVARMRMCVLRLELDKWRAAAPRFSSHAGSVLSGLSWPACAGPRLQLSVWPRGQSLSCLVVRVRMAVYWMAIDAKASRTMDFQEHCMVVRTGALRSHSTVCKTRGQNTRWRCRLEGIQQMVEINQDQSVYSFSKNARLWL